MNTPTQFTSQLKYKYYGYQNAILIKVKYFKHILISVNK